ncbi:FtsX-like permease family protein [Alteromonadaceae bacterium M269]|nr:FtsX-like permease family protein [Alteromonadaceae bacterium M269]
MFFDVFISEVLQSWKSLLKKPGYMMLATMTLSMGVSACIVVFALVKASFLAPISVPNIDQVVRIGGVERGDHVGGMAPIQFMSINQLPNVQSIGIAAPAVTSVAVQNTDRTTLVSSWMVDKGFLDVLSIPMQIGRGFNSNESKPNGPDALIVSYGYWQEYFGGNASVLGKTLLIDGAYIPIVGVLPIDFPYKEADILMPLALDPDEVGWSGSFKVIARMDSSTSIGTVSQAAGVRLHSLDVEYKINEALGQFRQYAAQPIESALRAQTRSRTVMIIFSGCAAVLLFIVLANLSNLSLLRIMARSHDSAVRRALGAPLTRLLLPIASEQLLVAVLGGVLGLSIAWISLQLADSVLPPYWFISASSRPDIGIESILFSIGLSLFVMFIAMAFGAWRIRYSPMKEYLVSGGRTGSGRKSSQLGRILVVLQASLATLLLLMAALSARTFWKSSQVDYGFDGGQSLAFYIKPGRTTYPDQQTVLTMASALTERLEAFPGIERVGFGTNIPASNTDHHDTAPFLLDDGRTINSITSYLISPGYFEAIGMELDRGRTFDTTYAANTDSIIVSEELEKGIQTDMLDKRLTLPFNAVNPEWENLPLTIRGVSKGVRAHGPNRQLPPIVWIPFMANTEKLYDLWRDSDSLWFVVKVKGDPASFQDEALKAVRDIAPTLSVGGLQPVSEYQSSILNTQQLNLTLILVFAGVALSLSSIGMYSVMAVTVADKKHEFGVKSALGAQPGKLMGDVLKGGSISLGIGIVLGLLAAVAASNTIERFLYGADAADPISVLIIIVVLMISGLIACIKPAYEAAKTKPMQSLRME